MAMSLHSPCLRGGEESTLSRKTPKHSLVQSTMQKSMVFRTRYLGTKGIVSRSSVRSLQNLANIVLSSLVPLGEVSRRDYLIPSANLLISKGPGYRSESVFDLDTMQPFSLKDLLDPFQSVTSDVVLYLPRTSDLRQIANQTKDKKILVMHYCMEGASKVRCMTSPLVDVNLTCRLLCTGNLHILRGLPILLSLERAMLGKKVAARDGHIRDCSNGH